MKGLKSNVSQRMVLEAPVASGVAGSYIEGKKTSLAIFV
jgi:hypothetical protein